MAAEIKSARDKARRAKDLALDHAIEVLEDKEHQTYSKELYNLTYTTVLKNAVPRTMEHGGDPDNQTPIPVSILSSANVQPDNSDKENTSDVQENPSSTGRDISE